MDKKLEQRLVDFRSIKQEYTAGMLGTVLVVTNRVRTMTFPISPDSLMTQGGGQVSKLNGNAINKILKSYGVANEVGTETGRTSRGTPAFAREYAGFLNALHAESLLDLDGIESWWVQQFKEYFASEPFKLRYEHDRALVVVLRDLLEQAMVRQRKTPGKMYVGAMLQHLVGAKLELALPSVVIEHNGFEVADSVSNRAGDFSIDESIIHCTTAPSEYLLKKCIKNIDAGKRPIILTIRKMIGAAEGLAETHGVDGKIEVMDAVQFLAANLYEMSLFRAAHRKITIDKLVDKYNEIVSMSESDASMRIEID